VHVAPGDRPTPRGPLLDHGRVNVTPDSFSDGGRYFDRTAAIERGLELVKSGADIVDIGGESTRPGAGRIARQEAGRVLPVIRELAAAGAYVSVDTMRAEVAAPRSKPAPAWSTTSAAASPTRP
jgi:dihydropteroate synthase